MSCPPNLTELLRLPITDRRFGVASRMQLQSGDRKKQTQTVERTQADGLAASVL